MTGMKGTKTGKSVSSFPFCCRYFSCGKRTVISSNLNLEGVRQRYSPQVASRLEGEYLLMAFFGQDIRLLKKQR